MLRLLSLAKPCSALPCWAC